MMLFRRWLPVIFAVAVSGSVYAQKLVRLPNLDKEWSEDYPPFRIAGNLYYVGTYELAAYLVATPEGHILINTGLDDSAPLILAHVEQLGFKVRDIKILLTNQAHFDHVGAMAAIKAASGAQLMVNAKDAPSMADGGNSDYIMGGKGPMFMPVRAERLLHDQDTIQLGGTDIVMLDHPGHTKGSCSFLIDVKDEQQTYRVLIANMPSILSETKLAGMPAYPEVGKDYAYTLKAMKGLQFDLWLAAHASQFGLHKKHQPGAACQPEVFKDRAGYDAALEELRQAYDKKLKEQ